MAAAVARRGGGTGGGYTYTAQPRPVAPQRNKFRDDSAPAVPASNNIMYDPRVVRGSTYGAQVLPTTAEPDPVELQKQQEARRRARLRKQQERAKQQESAAPEPVEGRVHREIQTELFLEEIMDRPIEADAEVQTDQLLDRPASPKYVPVKRGEDRTTQVYEGDLFDFDFEVEPILDVLVGKTLEQSLLEVLEEEELENMRLHQIAFGERREAELAETQRLEEAERRRFEEKERRLQQERDRVAREREIREKVAARAYAQHYLSDLMGTVFGSLNENGFFYDTVSRDVDTGFMPWLMERVSDNLNRMNTAREMADMLVAQSIEARDGNHQRYLVWAREQAEKRRLAEIERQKKEAEAAAKRAEEEAKRKAEEEAAEGGAADDRSGDDRSGDEGESALSED